MTANYTRDDNGNPARPGNSYYRRTEELPYVLGEGAVRQMARELADALISDARTLEGPVVWVTGNSYMPPIRSFTDAERVYDADNNRYGELLAWFAEMVEMRLSDANVLMECPDYDNALYVVDLTRYEYDDSATGDDLNSEWKKRTP